MSEDMFTFAILFILVVGCWIYPAICFQRIAQKSNTEPSWLVWVPIASLYLLCKLARTSGWWMLLCIISYIGAIFTLILLSRVPKCLGVNDGSRFLIIVPVVNFIYLGYLAFRQEVQGTILQVDA